MAATKKAISNKEINEELKELQDKYNDLVELLKAKGSEKKDDIKSEMANKLEGLQNTTEEGLKEVYEKGTEGVEAVSGRIKQNPVASILVAFGVGYVLSKVSSNK
ncbi:YqjD family protein [uncultured Cocleimonas sp.]|uniref:DUF883 family protein n=1 Tax=uncultured Cocleimonas sp. TaxID=1051587 RepID=UPI002613E15A|nr:hypothetical protein [uncultured Cocleimonas sp.]